MKDLKNLRKEITEIDEAMAGLFLRRMKVSAEIAEVKREQGLPVYDPVREAENREKGADRVPERFRDLYLTFLQTNMDLSKDYQRRILEDREEK